MRKIIGWFRHFHSGRLSWVYYLITIFFTGTFVAANEIFGLQNLLVRTQPDFLKKWGGQMVLYFLAYYPVLLLYCATHRQWHILRKPELWLKSLLPIGLYAWTSAWPWPDALAREYADVVALFFVRRCFNNLLPIVCTFFLFIILKWIYDRGRDGFYGLGNTGFDAKPYLYLLAALSPFIVAAGFTDSFQLTYPKYRPGGLELRVPEYILAPVFEICYAIDFLQVEWLFRGMLIIGLSRVLGPACLLPMCTLYCIIHFGKPLGETISSFFGGYILGILALYSRNIAGGVLIHVGIAWLMEAAAFVFGQFD